MSALPPGQQKWEKAVPIFPSNFIKSSKFASTKPFVPTFMHDPKANHSMFLLLANEYARIYEEEKKMYERRAYPAKEKANFLRKNVKRGLRLKKQKIESNQEQAFAAKNFKMKKFENIPSKVDHDRSRPRPKCCGK